MKKRLWLTAVLAGTFLTALFGQTDLGVSPVNYEVVFNSRLPYKQLFVEGHFRLGDQIVTLGELMAASGSLDPAEVGRLLFAANTDPKALERFTAASPTLGALSEEELFQGVGAAFGVLLNGGKSGLEDVNAVVSRLGPNATVGSKLLFLQILSSITEDIYEASKLNPRFTWDGKGRAPTLVMLDAMSQYVQGEDASKGVCFDSESMMNEFSAILGLQGAFLFGPNALGMLHPEGLYFDTSVKNQTKAILHDWTKMAVITYDTPTEFADALEQINGSHLMARVLYDGHGQPLKLIHSSGDKIVLSALGHEGDADALTAMAWKEESPQKPTVSRPVTFSLGDFRLGLQTYDNRVAQHNLLVTLGLPRLGMAEDWFAYEGTTVLGFSHENPGILSSYTLQPSNEHVNLILRHESSLAVPNFSLVPEVLAVSFLSNLEVILGAYQHFDSLVYKSSIMIPVIEGKFAGQLAFFNKKKQGWEFDLTGFASYNFLYPQQVTDILSSISTYLNAVPDEMHLLGRLWMANGAETLAFVDGDLMVTNIDKELRLGVGVTDGRRFRFSAAFVSGYPNKAFPYFYTAGSRGIQFSTQYLIVETASSSLLLSLDIEAKQGPSPQNRLAIGVRYQA